MLHCLESGDMVPHIEYVRRVDVKKIYSYLVFLLAKRMQVAWKVPSIPVSRPVQSYAFPHASFTLEQATLQKNFVSSWRQILLIPIGWTPGNLSRTIKKLA